jgi:putative SbcD/Mre11-related phosphoesterase
MRVLNDWILTAEGAAIHRPTATAVIADLHLGYGEARRGAGEAVPLPTVAAALAPLAGVAAAHEARRLVIAGDLFEAGARAGLVDDLRDWLGHHRIELLAVVPGNHDRRLDNDPCGLPLFPQAFVLGDWKVLHGDGRLPAGPLVHGHFHPCLRWRGVVARCFLVGTRRLVLPAFSADAAGVGILRDRRWARYRCLVPLGDRVLDFGEVEELRRRRRLGSSSA